MNYLGRLVTNVRGFYSEINSATLTGAIDIVVIRNEDGSFTGSPFHVRFGKLGVLRSREKIVDIEINGEPVPLHMKLGDAGEAFFVHETDDSVPTSLATSPIPSSHQLETVVDDKKDKEEEDEQTEVEDEEKGRKAETESKNGNLEDTKKGTDTSRELVDTEADAEKPSTSGQSDESLENVSKGEIMDEGQMGADQGQNTDDHSESEMSKEQTDNPPEDVTSGTELSPGSKDDGDGEDLKSSESSLSVGSPPKSDSIPIPGRRRGTIDPLSDAESGWPESDFADRHDLGHQFYPFSDLDTPVGSPSSGSPEKTRPPSPQRYVSDTEIEINQGQDSSMEDELSWTWGKLPKASKVHVGLQGERKPSDHSRSIDSSHAHKAKRKEALSKISHKARGEGMYLEDLSALDQEVAALYLNQALSSRVIHNNSDDHESGIGQSLPCSPSNEEISKQAYHNIAMSLCGGLKNGKVAQDQFLQSMVSYEDFCATPSMLSNPKLVIKINDRYFNWQIAAPMLMSQLMFQKPLSQETLKSLVKQHMPKKEKRRPYSYWFTWRANYDDKSSDEDDDEMKKQHPHPHPHTHQHRPRSHSSSSRHQQAIAELVNQERPRTISDCTSGNESDPASSMHYKKVIRLTSEELASLNLKDGPNTATFSVTTKYQGTASCSATIYLWNYNDKIVISDIDGTITKSDVLGHILPQAGYNWAQSGVAHFFTAIQKNGYKLLYLSARAIGQAQTTRDYLKSVKQDETALPGGPLLLSPESLIKAFHRELIEKKPEEFKIACLRDIQSLFPNRNPFHAGFGNKINDALAYRTVGVSVSRIFTINHKGEVRHELTNTFQSSYLKLSDLVDQMFPSYKSQGRQPSGLVAPDEFSSFTYWRPPVKQLSLEEVEDVMGEDEGNKP